VKACSEGIFSNLNNSEWSGNPALIAMCRSAFFTAWGSNSHPCPGGEVAVVVGVVIGMMHRVEIPARRSLTPAMA
jgi:hypothetical protein